ncbi:MAG TPA: PASTA domain-containing protein [Solirubrobacteraceae bacterium]
MPRNGRTPVAVSLAVLIGLVVVAPANALTLGTTTAPSNDATATQCLAPPSETEDAIQLSTDANYDDVVPAGGGVITSWSFNATGATAGTPYGLVVARPSAGSYQVVGGDVESVPASSPAVATFTLASPIVVQAGDLLGAVIEPTNTAYCYWTEGSSLTSADVLGAGPGDATPGSTVTLAAADPDPTLLNMSANLVQSEDVGLTQRVLPSLIPAGGDAVFLLSLTDPGPVDLPVTVTDTIPAGLTIQSATADGGTCTVTGQQTVSCAVPSAPTSVLIVVSAATAGTYSNTASASTSLSDPNPANNTAAATLGVTAAAVVPVQNPAPECHTVSLSGAPLKVAKAVVTALGCKVGKLTSKSSKSVPKGDVLSTSPGAGKTLALGTKVSIVSSSGKPKPKPKKKKKKTKHHGKR